MYPQRVHFLIAEPVLTSFQTEMIVTKTDSFNI